MKYKNRCGEFEECIECISPFLLDYESAGLLNVCVFSSRCKHCPNCISMELVRSDIVHFIADKLNNAISKTLNNAD